MSTKQVALVSQATLRAIVKLRVTEVKTRALLRELGGRIDAMETGVMASLGDGAKVESGKLGAAIATELGACRPPWKDVYIEHMNADHGVPAKAAEETIRTDYPPVSSKRLLVYDL